MLSETVHTWLPKADVIMIGSGETQEDYEMLGQVPWDKFYSVMKPHLKKLDYHPERYDIDYFPNEVELKEMLGHNE